MGEKRTLNENLEKLKEEKRKLEEQLKDKDLSKHIYNWIYQKIKDKDADIEKLN